MALGAWTPHRQPFLLSTDLPRTELSVRCRVPANGFPDQYLDLDVPRLRGTLPVRTVTLPEDPTERGDVWLQFVGPDVALLDERYFSASTERFATVLLYDPDLQNSGPPLVVTVDALDPRGTRHRGISVGEYLASVSYERGTLGGPPPDIPITVRPGGSTTVQVTLAGYGATRFSIVDADGEPYSGRITLTTGRLRDGDVRATETKTLSGPPYSIGPMKPADYVVKVEKLPGRSVRDKSSASFTVAADHWTEVRLELGDFVQR